MNILSILSHSTPKTGDDGLNPIIIFLLILCVAIVIGCIIWTIFINKKNPKHTITVVSAEDEAEPEATVVEEIPNADDNGIKED